MVMVSTTILARQEPPLMLSLLSLPATLLLSLQPEFPFACQKPCYPKTCKGWTKHANLHVPLTIKKKFCRFPSLQWSCLIIIPPTPVTGTYELLKSTGVVHWSLTFCNCLNLHPPASFFLLLVLQSRIFNHRRTFDCGIGGILISWIYPHISIATTLPESLCYQWICQSKSFVRAFSINWSGLATGWWSFHWIKFSFPHLIAYEVSYFIPQLICKRPVSNANLLFIFHICFVGQPQ